MFYSHAWSVTTILNCAEYKLFLSLQNVLLNSAGLDKSRLKSMGPKGTQSSLKHMTSDLSKIMIRLEGSWG